jgi:Protein of unknown function (DUF2846)
MPTPVLGINEKPKAFSIMLLSVALLFSGCASVALASREKESEALDFGTKAGQARLYVFRKSQYAGSGLLTQIVLNGKIKGSLKAGSFFCFSLVPGSYSVAYISADAQRNLRVDLESGKNYYVELVPRVEDLGFWKFQFSLADEAHAQETIRRCHLAETLD